MVSDYEQNLMDQIPPHQLLDVGEMTRKVEAAMAEQERWSDWEWCCPECYGQNFEAVGVWNDDAENIHMYWYGKGWRQWDQETELQHCSDCGLIFEEPIELRRRA